MNDHENSRPMSRQAEVAAAKKEHLQCVESKLAEVSSKHDKHVKALEAWKESELDDAVNFTVANHTSAIWNQLSRTSKYSIKEALTYQGDNIILRQEVAEFLATGVDLKISVRNGLGAKMLIQHLHQIIDALANRPELAGCSNIKYGFLSSDQDWTYYEQSSWVMTI